MPVSTRKTARSGSPLPVAASSTSTPSKPPRSVITATATSKKRLSSSLPSASKSQSRTKAIIHAMSTLNTYTFTTPLLIFFAITHTVGGLLYPNDYGPAGNAAYMAMRTAQFDFFGARRTLHDFYMGFGLMCTVFLLMSAAISWYLGKLVAAVVGEKGKGAGPGGSRRRRLDDVDGVDNVDVDHDRVMETFVRPIQWILFVSHIANMMLCYVYFFVPPMFVSTLITLLLGWECVKEQVLASFW